LLTREGAEFVIAIPPEGHGEPEAFGTQATDPVAAWTRHALEITKQLGEKIEAGTLSHLVASSAEKQLALLANGKKSFLIGWPLGVAADQIFEPSKILAASWDS
jgi:hypothetical protein